MHGIRSGVPDGGLRAARPSVRLRHGISVQPAFAFGLPVSLGRQLCPQDLYPCSTLLSPAAAPVAAGFTHAAFVFGCESSVSKAGINGKEVPVGALVSFIQKVRPRPAGT